MAAQASFYCLDRWAINDGSLQVEPPYQYFHNGGAMDVLFFDGDKLLWRRNVMWPKQASSAPEGNSGERDSKSTSISQPRRGETSDVTDSSSLVIKDFKVLNLGTDMMFEVSIESGHTAPAAEGYGLVYSIDAKASISEVKQELLKEYGGKPKELCELNFHIDYIEASGAVAVYGFKGLDSSVPPTFTVHIIGGHQLTGPVGIKAQVLAFTNGEWREIASPYSGKINQ